MSLLGDILLEELVKAEPGKPFRTLLARHGPIVADEVALLAERARDSRAAVRRNAVTLLAIAPAGGDRDALLRALARDADDPQVVAIAAAALPDGAAIATARAALIQRALHASDPKVVGAAVRLAWLAGLPGIVDELRAKLAGPDRAVRTAALDVLAEGGAGPLAPAVRDLLLDPARRGGAMTSLYRALLRVDDPTLADAIARSLDGASPADRVCLTNAVRLADPAPAWVRDFLMAQVQAGGPWRWSALHLLAEQPDAPRAPIVAVCRDYLAAQLATGASELVLAMDEGVAACTAFLGTLAGRSFRDLRDAADFATTWTSQPAER